MRFMIRVSSVVLCVFVLLQALAAQENASDKAATTQDRARKRPLVVSSPVAGVVWKVEVKEGEVVEKGQTLVVLDDRLAQIGLKIAKKRLAIAEAKKKSSKAGLKLAEDSLIRLMKLRNQNLVSPEKIVDAKLEIVEAEEEVTTSAVNVEIAQLEIERAQLRAEMHRLVAPEGGVVAGVRKKAGESIARFGAVVEIRPK